MFGDIFGCHHGGLLLALSEQRPEKLLDILSCIGQTPPSKNRAVHHVNRAEVEETCRRGSLAAWRP